MAMTNTPAQATRRWADADEQARRVLAAPTRRRVPAVLAVSVLVVPVLVAVLVALVVPPASTARFVAMVVLAGVGFALVAVDIGVMIAGRRRHPEWLSVTRSLLAREQRAVNRVIRERERPPADRQDVVTAAAIQKAAGAGLASSVGMVIVFASLGSSGTLVWMVYGAFGIVNLVTAAFLVRDVIGAQRYLDLGPR